MDNSGPAFPSYRYDGTEDVWHHGMTLRDYFAGQALIGRRCTSTPEHTSDEILAKRCYEIADALIAEREKES